MVRLHGLMSLRTSCCATVAPCMARDEIAAALHLSGHFIFLGGERGEGKA